MTQSDLPAELPMTPMGTVLNSAVLENVWAVDDDIEMDADCSPTKVCRNAREFTFDGIAEEGGDLASSWKQLLAREGKLSTDGGSLRDLVMGDSAMGDSVTGDQASGSPAGD